MMYATPTSSSAFTKAEANGWRVDVRPSNEFQLDFDSAAAYEEFQSRFQVLSGKGFFDRTAGDDILLTASPSGVPWRNHVRVRFANKQFSDVRAIGFQAALGSDPLREQLSLLMVEMKDPSPVLLFETPETFDLIRKWRGQVPD